MRKYQDSGLALQLQQAVNICLWKEAGDIANTGVDLTLQNDDKKFIILKGEIAGYAISAHVSRAGYCYVSIEFNEEESPFDSSSIVKGGEGQTDLDMQRVASLMCQVYLQHKDSLYEVRG